MEARSKVFRASAVAAALFAASATTMPESASEDRTPGQDHRLFPRMPGFEVVEYVAKDSATARFRTRPGHAPTKVTGRYWHWHFARRRATSTSERDVRGHYSDALRKTKARSICEVPPDVDGLVVADGKETWLHVRVFTPGRTYQVEIVERPTP